MADTREEPSDGRRHLGAWGEDLATTYLADSGMEILDRNWRCREGEIDIVARDGRCLVVCEVKTRTTDHFGTPLAAVTAIKVRRLRRLACAWMQAHSVSAPTIRLDVIGILAQRGDRPVIEHLRGVG